MNNVREMLEAAREALVESRKTFDRATDCLVRGDLAGYFLHYHLWQSQHKAVAKGLEMLPVNLEQHIIMSEVMAKDRKRVAEVHTWVAECGDEVTLYAGIS